jgi:ABC-type amino acid transport substrate-binding protein
MLVEPDISPLAKRLAEENNVNWRGLHGSGAGGKIVERDVLEYLAKVMAGEEDLNPTAEPLPEGMDAWPEDDVRSFYGGAVPAAQTETSGDDDLFIDTADLASFEDVAPVAASTHVSSEEAPALDEDIFLIDEEIEESVTHVAQSAVPAFEEDPVDFAMSDDIETAQGVAEVATFDDISEFDDVETEVMAAITGDGGEDLFTADDDVENLASLFVDDITSDMSEESDVMIAEMEAVTAEPEQPSYEAVTSFEAPAEPEFEIPAFTTSDTNETLPEDVLEAFSPEATEPMDVVTFEADVVAESISEDTFATIEQPEVEMVEDVQFESDVTPEPHVAEPEFAPVAEVNEYQQAEPSFNDVIPAVSGAIAGAGIAAMTSTPEPVVIPSVVGNIPLVSYGVLLRRHVDLSSLIQAQYAVGEEMGQGEPASMASFLLRAAAKAQHKVSLVSGQLGLAVIRDGGVSVVAINEASSTPFRQVLNQMQQALSAHQTESVALVVADMSGFDIDEAVLNMGVPVLTLGRTMYDSSQGTHHSTLSLSGNVSVESGTKFLSAVAELLNAPVRLVI